MTQPITICVLDSNNYFTSVATIYYDKRAKEYGSIENGYDIEKPDKEKLKNCSAKWNFEKEEWTYESFSKEQDENVEVKIVQTPMYYLKLERNNLLKESDSIILDYYEKGKEIPESLSNYRNQLRDLPKLIENGEIEGPVFTEDSEQNVRNIMSAKDIISFDWPKLPELENK